MSRNVKEEYIPGSCNIGGNELSTRKRFAYIGVALAFIYALAIYYFSLEREWRLPIAIPVFMAALGFFQAGTRFCVKNAFLAKAVMSTGELVVISNKDYMAKDKRRAVKVIFYCLVIAAFVATLFYYFPV